jgi:hypothetical protein
VVFRLKAEVGNLAPATDLDVLRVVLADGGIGVGHVGDLEHLLAQAPLDLRKLPLLQGDALLHGARLGDEPLPALRVALLADAPGKPVLLLLELVQLLYEQRAPVG